MSFDWKKVEEKWQREWEETRIFEVDPGSHKENFFATVPYPYTSGTLHVGHGRTYTLEDVYVKFYRMRGLNVLWPMAFHITGTPVLAISKRIGDGDQSVIHDHMEYVSLHNPENVKEIVRSFTKPENVAEYYASVISKDLKELGCSIDWRRSFTTGDPEYNQFIRWQYYRLNALNFLKKGRHPVFFCPSCNNPVTTDDIKGGDELELNITEFDLLKEYFEDGFLVAATLRSETIFGVTNIWVNPRARYVKAEVDKEIWYVSERCAEKMREQNYSIKIIERMTGMELVGKEVNIPLAERVVKILPAEFVDVEVATGVVNSVPAHAPYDFIALEELKKDKETIRKSGLSFVDVEKLKPIGLIRVKGFSEWPAADVSRKFMIESQSEIDKLEKATQEVYNLEYYNGVMKENCGKYAGLSVQEAKTKIFERLQSLNLATTMPENMTKDRSGNQVRDIMCRCGSKIFVKLLKDQWFLDYSNKEWKSKAKQLLKRMDISPETYRKMFEFYIDWLHEWACARTRGLGTKLPYDERWIIESLSDSTIYMAFYTIIHRIKQNRIRSEQLSIEFFDYVYLGNGNPEKVARNSKIDVNQLKGMREEFLHWYPVDERRTAPMHISNHLTFFIFHHAAIFPPELWPKKITLNEALIAEGRKMSKSLGNVIPLARAIREYGADTVRLYLSHAADASTTLDWRAENVKALKSKLENLYDFCQQIISLRSEGETTFLDEWLVSVLQKRKQGVVENMEVGKTRTAAENAFFEIWNDIRWYLRRTKKPNARTLREVLRTWVLLMTPFTPHMCHEIWSKMSEDGFIIQRLWPKTDFSKIELGVEETEELVKATLNDTYNIVRATKMVPRGVYYYVASPWKWEVYLLALKKSISEKVTIGKLMGEVMSNPRLKAMGKKVAFFVQEILEDVNRMSKEVKKRRLQIGPLDENAVIRNATDFLERELKAKVEVYLDEDPERYDPKRRAQRAIPFRPAIFINQH